MTTETRNRDPQPATDPATDPQPVAGSVCSGCTDKAACGNSAGDFGGIGCGGFAEVTACTHCEQHRDYCATCADMPTTDPQPGDVAGSVALRPTTDPQPVATDPQPGDVADNRPATDTTPSIVFIANQPWFRLGCGGYGDHADRNKVVEVYRSWDCIRPYAQSTLPLHFMQPAKSA